MVENVEAAGAGKEGESRRRRPMEVPADLDSRFLRVGDKLYRSAHDKQPVATITPDRIKAKDRDSLPDLIRLAKENGWTSIKVSGDAEFQRAAYLAASAQGIKVDGYKPDDKTKAAAEREQARQAGVPDNQARSTRTANQTRDTKEQAEPRKAQSHVALAMAVAAERFPADHEKRREFVGERKEEVAARIGRGETVAGIEVKARQEQRVREMAQDQILQKSRSR
jgi:hypothetical protein